MDVEGLWNSLLGEFEVEVSRANYASFFLGTKLNQPGGSTNDSFVVICPNPTSQNMLKGRFFLLVKRAIENRLQRPITLTFEMGQTPIEHVESGPLFESQRVQEATVRSAGINPNYTFDNFAVSESNQMAFAAAQAVATKPGSSYNPLFLWGTVGVGKTHLMQAIGRHVLINQPQTNTIYCTGEEFTNGIIEAIRARSSASFKKKYRGASLLMVDDIQFIAGKESVQMEFFHTFNSVLNAGGQIILTSDKPPSEIRELEARLKSRFEGGLTIDINPPNFELRTAILLIKAQAHGVLLPIDTAKAIAANIEDVRALEGALLRYVSEEQSGRSPHESLSHIISQNNTNDASRNTMSPEKVLEIAASHFDLKPQQVTGKSRKQIIARPRQIIMYLLRQELGLSFQEIGTLLGGRDHTTIMHGVEKITALLPKKESIRTDLSEMRRVLWG